MPVGYINFKKEDFQDPTLSQVNMAMRQHTDELNRLGGLNGTVSIVSGISANGPITGTSFGFGNARILAGLGNPNGKVGASLGSLYLNLNGGANQTLWVKESGGDTNMGWTPK